MIEFPKALPSVVGRMDDVVDAIRKGDAATAFQLLQAECERRMDKVKALRIELQNEQARLNEVSQTCGLLAEFDKIQKALRTSNEYRKPYWDIGYDR